MKKVAGILIALGVTICGFAGVASANDNKNSVEYWEQYFEDAGIEADCFKHEAAQGEDGLHYNDGPGGHGVADGTTFTLNPFNPDWEQDEWVLIRIKSSQAVYSVLFPTPGVYLSPSTNPHGEPQGISYVLLCKGSAIPVVTTTTSTTLQETTTSVTIPVDSSSSVPANTSTSVTETTTPAGSTETTRGITATTEAVTLDLTNTNQGLPETGSGERWAAILSALALIIAGIAMLIIRKREYA